MGLLEEAGSGDEWNRINSFSVSSESLNRLSPLEI